MASRGKTTWPSISDRIIMMTSPRESHLVDHELLQILPDSFPSVGPVPGVWRLALRRWQTVLASALWTMMVLGLRDEAFDGRRYMNWSLRYPCTVFSLSLG